MIHNVLAARPRIGALLALLIATMALTACGDDDSSSEGTDTTGAEVTADGASNDTSDDASAPSDDGSGPSAPGRELTEDDGWLEVHDLDIPGPGEGWLSIEGQNIDLEVECSPGGFSQADWMLFSFGASGRGVAADGREVQVTVERRITSVEEAATGYGPQEYGSVQVTVRNDDGLFGNSVLVSPADADPDGTRLPVVRVDETGAFTVVEDIPALPMAPDPLAGPMELAGRCPAP